jgi:DMSO/TMAO reductase YedYZ molybdopterin-dependent catalytic subunit
VAPRFGCVENQLGDKMVKWIERIEFIESKKQVSEGEGGTNEDDEYFAELRTSDLRIAFAVAVSRSRQFFNSALSRNRAVNACYENEAEENI